jgi:hypothetical protein
MQRRKTCTWNIATPYGVAFAATGSNHIEVLNPIGCNACLSRAAYRYEGTRRHDGQTATVLCGTAS